MLLLRITASKLIKNIFSKKCYNLKSTRFYRGKEFKMNILEQNLKAISKWNNLLANKIKHHDFTKNAQFEFSQAVSGDVNLSYNGICIHDSNNPQLEATNAFNKINLGTSSSITIIVGLGLGYLFKRGYLSSKGKIIIYEPNLDILRFTLEVVDFSTEFSDERVILANSQTELIYFLNEIYAYKDKLGICALASAYNFYKDDIDYFKNHFSEIKTQLESNYTCLFSKSYSWLIEGLKNLKNYKTCFNIDALNGKFKGKPAIIVSSGPSLEKNIEVFKQYKNKAIIFCAGNAYKTLKKNNIKPDFLVFIDNFDTTRFYKDSDVSDINVINQSIASNLNLQPNWKNKFIFYSNNDTISRWIGDIGKFDTSEYENKGTVSYCAMYSAFKAGCSSIILIGQDLAYTDGECYSKSSSHGEIYKCIFDEAQKKFKLEIINKDKFYEYYNLDELFGDKADEYYQKFKIKTEETNISTVPGQNGKMIPTEQNYASFITYFREFALANANSNLKLINSSTNGAEIHGFKNIELNKALENLPDLDFDVNTKITEILKNYIDPINKNQGEFRAIFINLTGDIKQYKNKAQKALTIGKQLQTALNKKNIDIQNVSRLTGLLAEHYVDFKDNLINKYPFLIYLAFKAILELGKIFEDDTEGSEIDYLNNIANYSTNFYSLFINRIETIDELIQQIIKESSD